MVMVF